MKKNLLKIAAVAMTIALFVFVSSCASDDNSIMNSTSDTIVATSTKGTLPPYVVTFDSIGPQYMAGPTSYGDNAYASYKPMITPYVDKDTHLRFEINQDSAGVRNFWNGGFVISDWNYKNNIKNNDNSDWWYSYKNQCSVYYGKESGDKMGGYGGGHNFAVMFGYVDSYNSQSNVKRPKITFEPGYSGIIKNIKVCLSSYTYGVIKYGNKFGKEGKAIPLKDIHGGTGYFKLLAYGYNGIVPSSAKPVEIYLAKYENHAPVIGPVITWTNFDTSSLGRVTSIEFNFEGNDTGKYGLNTPAYVCMDNISVTM